MIDINTKNNNNSMGNTLYTINPKDFGQLLIDEDVNIIDVSTPQQYKTEHLYGAKHCQYEQLVLGVSPAVGEIPSPQKLSQVIQNLNIKKNQTVIAYDHEFGAKASRFLWTLSLFGHQKYGLLNGGFKAYLDSHKATYDDSTNQPNNNCYTNSDFQSHHIVTKEEILKNIDKPTFTLLDVRTWEEFSGIKKTALNSGHIPQAKWMNCFDLLNTNHHHIALHTKQELQRRFIEKEITPDMEVVLYCHTHHRSSLSFIAMKAAGYSKIRCYPGSWAEWGNNPKLPYSTNI